MPCVPCSCPLRRRSTGAWLMPVCPVQRWHHGWQPWRGVCRSTNGARFIEWVRPEPEALLNATIFFDLRPLGGMPNWAKTCALLLSMTVATPSFQHLMAANACGGSAAQFSRRNVAVNDER